MRLIVDICLKKAQKGGFEPRRREGARRGKGATEGTEGASRVLRGNSLWITTGCALSERVPSGPVGCDPATASPGEAWFQGTAVGVRGGKNTKIYWMGLCPLEASFFGPNPP